MRLNFLLCFFLSAINGAFSQGKEIEINPFARLDKYPQFSNEGSGRSTTDYTKITGISPGIDLGYKIPISKTLSLKPGIGFYRYTFNHIEKQNTLFGKSDVRFINFPSPVLIVFSTDRYWYNTLSLNMSLEKIVVDNVKFQAAATVSLNNYFSFSRYYHLSYNPVGSEDYRKKGRGYFGSSALARINLVKKFKKINIGPSLLISLLDTWKTDARFWDETNSGRRSKWFNGIGLGISCYYKLTKK